MGAISAVLGSISGQITGLLADRLAEGHEAFLKGFVVHVQGKVVSA